MTPESSLAAAEADRRTEERKTPRAETAKERLDQARDENDLARLFRHAFSAGR